MSFLRSVRVIPVGRAAVSLALVATLAFTPLVASAAVAKPLPAAAGAKVDPAEVVLDRLTFGARPGDLERVRSMGVNAWLEEQLAPERIDDSVLEEKLDQFPALRMTQTEQIARYPTPAMVRQAAKSGYLPEDPDQRAILQDQVEFYQMRKEAAAKAKDASQAAPPQTAAAGVATQTMDGSAGDQAENGTLLSDGTRQKVTLGSSPQTAFGTTGQAASTGNAQRPNQKDINKGFAALEDGGDGMAKTGTRFEMAGGGTTATAAANAQQGAAPENLEQATPAMPQQDVNALLAMQPGQRYQRFLRMSPTELVAARKGVHGDMAKLGEGMSPVQRETLVAMGGTNRMISGELFDARLLRDIYSQRQIVAVMTDFWLNHFNVYIRKDGNMPSLLPEYEETVRSHALGRFEDLLEATAKSPAMQLYLDNAQSVGPDSLAAAGRANRANVKPKKASAGLNENYARELMELHTLGVNGGYTQKDVTEVAKVFTGWGIERPGEGGEFVFNERRHEPGSKQVLGKTIHEAGESEGEEVLHMLATSPATAHFISQELAQRFVSDTPPPAMVDRMAAMFLKSSGDIRAVLRTMVQSPEFFAPATVDAKIKTPLEYVVSAVRATSADVQNALPLAQSLERLGMPLYGCQPPTGYKWDAETWLNSAALVNRMNFALLLAANKVNGTTINTTALLNDAPPRLVASLAGDGEAQRKERELEFVVLPDGVSAQTRAAVLSQTDDSAVQQAMRDFNQAGPQKGAVAGAAKTLVNQKVERAMGVNRLPPNAPPPDQQAAVMLGLLLGSPEFQRR